MSVFKTWYEGVSASFAHGSGESSSIAGAVRTFFLLSLCTVGLFFVFWLDVLCPGEFTECTPTEICQTILLSVSTCLLMREAKLQPDMRRALVLAGGLVGCMLIREQDFFLDFISHGCWKWPAFALAAGCLAYAAFNIRETIGALHRFVRHPSFPYLLMGLVVVLVYSRLFGMGSLWKMLMDGVAEANDVPELPSEVVSDVVWRGKTAMEESSELLGYMLLTWSAFRIRASRIKGGKAASPQGRKDSRQA